jgi:hypothetical protein
MDVGSRSIERILAKALSSKEIGNEHFKNQRYQAAVECYSGALQECPTDHQYRLVLLKNRAACFLKLELFTSALEDCTEALRIDPNDVKALYRRALAYEACGKLTEAFSDLKHLLSIDPRNKEAAELARKLTITIKKRQEILQSTDGMIKEMFQALNDPDLPSSKVIMAVKNCAILSQELPGAEKLYQMGAMDLLLPHLDSKSTEVIHHILQTFAGMCTGHKARSCAIIQTISVSKLSSLISHGSSQVSCSAVAVTKQALLSFANEDIITPRSAESAVVIATDTAVIAPIVQALFTLLLDRAVTSTTRDHIMEMLISTTITQVCLELMFVLINLGKVTCQLQIDQSI